MMKFPILKKMSRKPTTKTKKVEEEVEVERPKTPATPESTDDAVISPTFASVEQEDTTIWSSTFTWNMQTTASELDAVSAMSNVWADENNQNNYSVKSDITKKNDSLDDKEDFDDNVWTDVQIVAGIPNNQSCFSVPITVPDSQSNLKSQIENVSTIHKVDESFLSHHEGEKEEKGEERCGREVLNGGTDYDNFDSVDLGKENLPSIELSKEFDEFTNSDVKLESNNDEIIYENTLFDGSFEKHEDEKLEKIIIDEKKDDDDFGAFECGEDDEKSSFDDFGEFKIDGGDSFDDFGDFEGGEKYENVPVPTLTEGNNDDKSVPQNELKANVEHSTSVSNWTDALDKVFELSIANERDNNERPSSIEDLVHNSNVTINADLNWSSFTELQSDKGDLVGFSWWGSQIQKAYVKSINSIYMIRKADRLPGSDLFNDDIQTSLLSPSTSDNHPTHDDKKRDVVNSTVTPVSDANNISMHNAPIESAENNDDKQSTDSNRNSWITMSDISFLESFSSRKSSVSSVKKSHRKSEPFLEDFLNTETASPTPPTNNSRIDSVIEKFNRNSANLSAKLGLKSLFGKSNDILVPINENPSSPSVKVKTSVAVNLIDDSINDMSISKKTKEGENGDTLSKNKNNSTFSAEYDDMISTSPSNGLNCQNVSSSFKDGASTKSFNNNFSLSTDTKFNDEPLNSEKLSYDANSEFGEMVSASNGGNLDDWISSNDLSILETFTNNSKPSSSSSRKSQQNVFFDFPEFDSNSSSSAQPQKTSDVFESQSADNGNPIPTMTTNYNSKQEKQLPPQENKFNSNSEQLYSSSMNISSSSISSEFGEMVSANDTKNQNLHDDWTSMNQDNWMSDSGLSFLETLKTSPNNNRKSEQLFGDLSELISL